MGKCSEVILHFSGRETWRVDNRNEPTIQEIDETRERRNSFAVERFKSQFKTFVNMCHFTKQSLFLPVTSSLE